MFANNSTAQGKSKIAGRNCARIQLLLSFALKLALALSVKRYTFPNDYTRSLKVNTAVELLVQETFQLCSSMHRSVTLLCSCKPG